MRDTSVSSVQELENCIKNRESLYTFLEAAGRTLQTLTQLAALVNLP